MLKIFALFIVVTTIRSEPDVVVETPLGKILGSTNFKTRLEKQIYAFRGIRYAESPTANRRFQPPEPVKSWGEEILNATEEGPGCPQPRRIPPESGWSTSEDCLRLNVYTTELPNNVSKKYQLRSVVIYFHAGGFYSVAGISNYHGPQYLLDQDVVLVTVNYRLGTLGFISTGDENAPGNLGMKDQVAAMRWVKENIRGFGGNPNEVTIMGYSAGAISVSLHLVSPMSKGLFHRGISMSGASTGTYEYTNQFDLAKKQAELLNCSSNTSKEIIDCLRTKDAEEISTTFSNFKEVGLEPIIIWTPVIEPDHSGEKFLDEDPNKLFNEGRFMKVPFMVGVCEHEFAGHAYSIVANATLKYIWNNNFEYAAPIAFVYERNTTRSLAISKTLKDYYIGDQEINLETVQNFGKLFADGVIGWSGHRLANLLAKTNNFPVYYYKFAYKGRYSHFISPFTNKTGASHHDELIYLFYIQLGFPFFEPNDPETKMVEKMTTLWSNFIKTGNPTPEKDDILDNLIWEPHTANEKKYMNIDSNLSMRKNLFADRYAIWDGLFPNTIEL